MKKAILMYAAIAMCATCVISTTYCQINADFARVETGTQETDKQQDKVESFDNTNKIYANNISIKAVRAFTKAFKKVENVSWRITDDGGYVAQFKKDSVQTIVRYAANGACNYTLKKYAEKQMRADLRRLVRITYFDYAIQEITEIKLPGKDNLIYAIMIKTDDNFKILRICEGEMGVIGDYIKP